MIVFWLVLSLLAALLYRMGGTSLGTKWRDFGVPAIMVVAMTKAFGWHWSLLPCFLALMAALTTYNKWAGRWVWKVGRGDYDDVYWPSWAVTGLFYGLSMGFYAYYTGLWWAFGIRCAALTVFTALWSHFIDEVNFEESGRGFIIIATLPLFYIGG